MHTVDPNLDIDIKELFVNLLEICHNLIAPKLWAETRRKFIQNEPDSLLLEPKKYEQYDDAINKIAFEISLVIELLQPAQALKYFNFDKKQRRYICPNCYAIAFRETYVRSGLQYSIPRLAQLTPNHADSNSVYCIVCDKSSLVVREDCFVEDCPGNVIDGELHDICLTCGERMSD
jgi:hypothetical protein